MESTCLRYEADVPPILVGAELVLLPRALLSLESKLSSEEES